MSLEGLPIISAKVFVTTNVQAQLKAVATEAAEPRTFPGKISPIISCEGLKLYYQRSSSTRSQTYPWDRTETE